MNIEADVLTAIGWAEQIFRTPREKIDLDGMAAVAELAGDIKERLSTPENQARLARVGKMIAQDMPNLTAPAPAAVETEEPATGAEDYPGAHGKLLPPGM